MFSLISLLFSATLRLLETIATTPPLSEAANTTSPSSKRRFILRSGYFPWRCCSSISVERWFLGIAIMQAAQSETVRKGIVCVMLLLRNALGSRGDVVMNLHVIKNLLGRY